MSPKPSARVSSPVATSNTPGMRRAGAASIRLMFALRHRRAQHERLRHVRQIDIVGVASLPGDETQIFVTPHRLPDSRISCCVLSAVAPHLAQAGAALSKSRRGQALKHPRMRW